ncbi:hypothetical protein [Radiobacillus sp. PE A8.2]
MYENEDKNSSKVKKASNTYPRPVKKTKGLVKSFDNEKHERMIKIIESLR